MVWFLAVLCGLGIAFMFGVLHLILYELQRTSPVPTMRGTSGEDALFSAYITSWMRWTILSWAFVGGSYLLFA